MLLAGITLIIPMFSKPIMSFLYMANKYLKYFSFSLHVAITDRTEFILSGPGTNALGHLEYLS